MLSLHVQKPTLTLLLTLSHHHRFRYSQPKSAGILTGWIQCHSNLERGERSLLPSEGSMPQVRARHRTRKAKPSETEPLPPAEQHPRRSLSLPWKCISTRESPGTECLTLADTGQWPQSSRGLPTPGKTAGVGWPSRTFPAGQHLGKTPAVAVKWRLGIQGALGELDNRDDQMGGRRGR